MDQKNVTLQDIDNAVKALNFTAKLGAWTGFLVACASLYFQNWTNLLIGFTLFSLSSTAHTATVYLFRLIGYNCNKMRNQLLDMKN